MNIGKKIRRLRTLCGLTQEELADRCELTKGFISQVENNNTSPTIVTLNDILLALGTNLSDFFKDKEDNEKIVFNSLDYIVKQTDEQEITWLIPNSQKNDMEPVITNINPKSETPLDDPHEGQEFGYVLEGEIVLVIDSKEYLCKSGESFYYNTDKSHYIKNKTNDNAKVIWISSPPNF